MEKYILEELVPDRGTVRGVSISHQQLQLGQSRVSNRPDTQQLRSRTYGPVTDGALTFASMSDVGRVGSTIVELDG